LITLLALILVPRRLVTHTIDGREEPTTSAVSAGSHGSL